MYFKKNEISKKDIIFNKKINILETFSGIGAQNKAVKNLNKKCNLFQIVATVDWDARAIIAYAAIHHNLNENYEKILNQNNLKTKDEIENFLSKFSISLDSKNQSNLKGKDLIFKKYLAASIILSNNQVDITKLNPKIIEEKNINLITYSFPCQGLSVANMGRAKGINDSCSTSSLVWQIYRVLKESKIKPNYLIMENVKNLLSNKFIDQYKKWIKTLEKIGYKTFTTIINGIDTGSIQKRERVFALSIKKEINTPFSNDLNFKEYIKKHIKTKKLDKQEIKENFNKIFNFSLDNQENIEAIINNTPSRKRIVNLSKKINKESKFINTLTTKQDRLPCTGIIEFKNNFKNKLNYRFITPREAYKLMGFDDNDFDKLVPLYEKKILTKQSLYKQAGNSIIVQAIQNIFEVIYEIEKRN